MKRWLIVLACTFALLLAACGGEAGSMETIQIEDAWVRAATQMGMGGDQGDTSHMDGSMTAAYMLIRNNGEEPDRLLRVNTSAAHAAELHKSEETDGVMSMRPVEAIEIPAGGTAELKPGGFHMMLIGLTRDLVAGEKVELVLDFEKAGEVSVEAEVRSP